MTEQGYTEMLNQLVEGEIEEILVSKDEFMVFRNALMNHPNKKQIEGEAKLGGEVVYRLHNS